MCYQGSKSLFFDVMKIGQMFPSKVFRFQYDHSQQRYGEQKNVQGDASAKTY